jgi:DinB superfamily/Pentapeptide repeats (8 copies)
VADFFDEDLTGSRFERVDFTNAQFKAVDFSGVVMRSVDLIDVDIYGDVENLRINGVDVGPFIEAELDKRYPLRAKMRPVDPLDFVEAWEIVERLWEETVGRARALDPELLHVSVNGEWSFIETLRHLVFATDSWINRAVLGNPAPWDPLGLPWDEAPDDIGLPRDRDALPSLDEVLELRRGRMSTVRAVIENLSPSSLDEETVPVEAPGWPPSRSFTPRKCLLIILNEEWEHRRYAERDLAILETSTT